MTKSYEFASTMQPELLKLKPIKSIITIMTEVSFSKDAVKEIYDCFHKKVNGNLVEPENVNCIIFITQILELCNKKRTEGSLSFFENQKCKLLCSNFKSIFFK